MLGSVLLKHSFLSNNRAKDQGGAVCIMGLVTVEANATSFINNSAYDGGAVAAFPSNDIDVPSFQGANCNFTYNFATRGGGLFIGAYVYVVDSQIHYNRGVAALDGDNDDESGEGGAVYSTGIMFFEVLITVSN